MEVIKRVIKSVTKTVLHSLFRISVFNFIVDETVSTPTISFVSETPPLQYVSSIGHSMYPGTFL